MARNRTLIGAMVYHRELTPAERDILIEVLSHTSFPGVQELVDQVTSTTVVGGTPTLLDLAVADSVKPSLCPDGPVPVRAFVNGLNGETEGEILVWVEDGYLSALEFAWFTDEVPISLPSPERIRFDAS